MLLLSWLIGFVVCLSPEQFIWRIECCHWFSFYFRPKNCWLFHMKIDYPEHPSKFTILAHHPPHPSFISLFTIELFYTIRYHTTIAQDNFSRLSAGIIYGGSKWRILNLNVEYADKLCNQQTMPRSAKSN